MKSWFKTLISTCAIIPFAQCAMAPGNNSAIAAEPAPAAATATVDVDPGLWVLKDDDTTIYLFGTVHILKPGLSWFDEAVKDAFDKSDSLMLEMIMPEDETAVAQSVIPLALDQSGKTLPSRLTADELKAYHAALVETGLPANAFDAFEPWFPAMTLATLPLLKMGFDPKQGAEAQLTAAAKAKAKPIEALESLEEQIGFLDGLPETAQVAYLNSVVRDLPKLGSSLDNMVLLWGKGDTEGLAAAMNEGMAASPELAKSLLYDRNQRWADQLKARLDTPGTVFVAVGAGHLAGEKSVQDYLQKLGVTVKRIEY